MRTLDHFPWSIVGFEPAREVNLQPPPGVNVEFELGEPPCGVATGQMDPNRPSARTLGDTREPLIIAGMDHPA